MRSRFTICYFAINASTLAICLLMTFSNCFAQKGETFFSNKDLMLVGSYYYPEHWPQKDWERDIQKMSELGFEFTHFGEFAWSQMVPVPPNARILIGEKELSPAGVIVWKE